MYGRSAINLWNKILKKITKTEIDPKTKKKKIIITEKIDTCDFESDDNNWNGDPSYECRDCGAALSLRDIIIEKPEKEEKKEIKEPENAIESDEKEIIIRKIIGRNTNMIDMKNMNICICPECNYIFCAEEEKYHDLDEDEIIICNKCGAEIEAAKNNKEIIRNTLHDWSYI